MHFKSAFLENLHVFLANGSADKKPALPPKPQGPPSYREPPVPPGHEETNQHPDICINSAPPPRPVSNFFFLLLSKWVLFVTRSFKRIL